MKVVLSVLSSRCSVLSCLFLVSPHRQKGIFTNFLTNKWAFGFENDLVVLTVGGEICSGPESLKFPRPPDDFVGLHQLLLDVFKIADLKSGWLFAFPPSWRAPARDSLGARKLNVGVKFGISARVPARERTDAPCWPQLLTTETCSIVSVSIFEYVRVPVRLQRRCFLNKLWMWDVSCPAGRITDVWVSPCGCDANPSQHLSLYSEPGFIVWF